MASPNYAENNRIENMETKISNMISRLKMRNVSSFHMKTMATERVQGPFAYALEFPSTVVRVHVTNFGVLATFQQTTCGLTMRIEVTVKEKPGLKHLVFAYAIYGRSGWKVF